ncbi:histidine kinase [Glutamicibacter protophormiae]|uniref:sensor histidine kinase n=1 Tax=Glutamicibacter protophormiae TaxID=37930 RepID=UPI002A7EDE8C|nr:histidine kinase [Glutamicibacter protophormiae]WPR66456.1 histidine kinase [Glutamicibacter protophormiae]WPR69949.1 histidine kinase [Glutamicibacter protophormiae]
MQVLSMVAGMLKRRHVLRVVAALLAFVFDLFLWQGAVTTPGGMEMPMWLIPAALAGAYAVLLTQRRIWLGFTAFLLVSLLGLAISSIVGIVGSYMALFLMVRHSSTKVANTALAGMILPISVATYSSVTYEGQSEGLLVLMSWNIGFYAAVTLLCYFAARTLRRTENRLTTERSWAEAALEEARAGERLRISRDLHDSVAHSMTAVVLQVAGVRAILKKGAEFEKVDPVLADIQVTAEQSMRELHRLLGMLRSEEESQVGQSHTFEEIASLISSAQDSGLDVVLTSSGEAQMLDPSISHAGYRVVQEGLANAMKHGGEGCRVEISTRWTATQLTISVTSISGVMKRPAVSGGFGLLGLRERIGVSGGSLSHGPTPGGYLLKATLPVDAPEELPGAVRRGTNTAKAKEVS